MTLKQAQALLKGGLQASFAPPPIRPALLVTDAASRGDDQDDESADSGSQIHRTRIWEFGTNLHCSIIGTWVFPIDCVSHHAVAVIKRHCGLTGKPYEPLRTASLACLLSALASLTDCRQTVAAE